MFEILVYLYETYYRPDACPAPAALARKLSAVGFEEDEIYAALDWLSDMTEIAHDAADARASRIAGALGLRIYAPQEQNVLGTAAIGFIQFLETAKILDPVQREIVIERALALNESPVLLNKLKVIILMILWSQGKEPDALMFDDLFLSDEDNMPHSLH